MAGENLDNHVDVKNILVEMGTYFQVQVNFVLSFFSFNIGCNVSFFSQIEYSMHIITFLCFFCRMIAWIALVIQRLLVR